MTDKSIIDLLAEAQNELYVLDKVIEDKTHSMELMKVHSMLGNIIGDIRDTIGDKSGLPEDVVTYCDIHAAKCGSEGLHTREIVLNAAGEEIRRLRELLS